MNREYSVERLAHLMQKMYKISFGEAYDIVREMLWTISDTRDWMMQRGASTKEIRQAMRSIFQDYTGLSADGWIEHLFD